MKELTETIKVLLKKFKWFQNSLTISADMSSFNFEKWFKAIEIAHALM